MHLIAAVVLLEICLRVALPYLAAEMPEAVSVSIGLLVLMQLATIGAAHYTVQCDTVWDDIGWLVGTSMVWLHGGWHMSRYDDMYVQGDAVSIIMIAVAYVMMPLAVGLMPLIAMPLPARWRQGMGVGGH